MEKSKTIKEKKLRGKYLRPSEILVLVDRKLLFEALLGKIIDAQILKVPYHKTYISPTKILTKKEKKAINQFIDVFFPGEYEMY